MTQICLEFENERWLVDVVIVILFFSCSLWMAGKGQKVANIKSKG